jgi:hypothetical protein
MADIVHTSERARLEHHWSTSNEPQAALFRVLQGLEMRRLVRQQVRRESSDDSVQGNCFGITRSPTGDLACKSGSHADQRAIRAVMDSLLAQHPLFRCTSLQVNRGLRAALHIDNANLGISAFAELGPFSGGGLWSAEGNSQSVLAGGAWQLCNGRVPHCTLPFIGERISLIAFCNDASLQLFDGPGAEVMKKAQCLGFPMPSLGSLCEATTSCQVVSLAEGVDQYAQMCEIITTLSSQPADELVSGLRPICGDESPSAGEKQIRATASLLPAKVLLFLLSVASLLGGAASAAQRPSAPLPPTSDVSSWRAVPLAPCPSGVVAGCLTAEGHWHGTAFNGCHSTRLTADSKGRLTTEHHWYGTAFNGCHSTRSNVVSPLAHCPRAAPVGCPSLKSHSDGNALNGCYSTRHYDDARGCLITGSRGHGTAFNGCHSTRPDADRLLAACPPEATAGRLTKEPRWNGTALNGCYSTRLSADSRGGIITEHHWNGIAFNGCYSTRFDADRPFASCPILVPAGCITKENYWNGTALNGCHSTRLSAEGRGCIFQEHYWNGTAFNGCHSTRPDDYGPLPSCSPGAPPGCLTAENRRHWTDLNGCHSTHLSADAGGNLITDRPCNGTALNGCHSTRPSADDRGRGAQVGVGHGLGPSIMKPDLAATQQAIGYSRLKDWAPIYAADFIPAPPPADDLHEIQPIPNDRGRVTNAVVDLTPVDYACKADLFSLWSRPSFNFVPCGLSKRLSNAFQSLDGRPAHVKPPYHSLCYYVGHARDAASGAHMWSVLAFRIAADNQWTFDGHHAGVVTVDQHHAQYVGAHKEDSTAAQLSALLWATSLALERVAHDGARHIAIRHRSSMPAAQCSSTCAASQHLKLVAIASTAYQVLSMSAQCHFVTISKKTKDPWIPIAAKVATAALHASDLRTAAVLPFGQWTALADDAIRLQYLRHLPPHLAREYPSVDSEGRLRADPPGGQWYGLPSSTIAEGLLGHGAVAPPHATAALPRSPTSDEAASSTEAPLPLPVSLLVFNTMSLRKSGAIQIFASQLQHYAVFAAAALEARPHTSGVRTIRWQAETYIVAESEADAAGGYGNQLWISTTIPPYSGSSNLVGISNVSIVYSHKRTLFVRVSLPCLKILFIVAHAPYDGSAAASDHDRYWDNAMSILEHVRRKHDRVVVMCDANAQLRSTNFAHQSHAELFTSFLSEAGLAEFTTAQRNLQHGADIVSYIGKGHSIQLDYIGGDCNVIPIPGTARSLDRFASATLCPDHVPVTIDAVFALSPSSTSASVAQLRFDRSAIEKPENRSRIASMIAALPRCSSAIEPTTHYSIISQQLSSILTSVCPPVLTRKSLWKSYFTNTTACLVKLKAQTHQKLNHANLTARISSLHVVWRLWKSAHYGEAQPPWLRDTPYGARFGAVAWWQLEAARCTLAFRRTGRDLATAVKKDKTRFLRGKVSTLEAAAIDGIAPPLWNAVKWFAGRRQIPAHQLADFDGRPAADAQEAAANAHSMLARLTDGTTLGLAQYVDRQRKVTSEEAAYLENVPRHVSGMVAATQLTLQLARAKRGKALGPCQEPPELCRHFARELALLFDPLVQKMYAALTPAMQVAAARVIFIHKSPTGPKELQSNRRAIWLGNQVAKSLGAALRPRVSTCAQKASMEGQHGLGWHAAGVDAAHLALGAIGAAAAVYKRAYANIFIDIKTAFDATIAALALPVLNGREIVIKAVCHHGFSSQEAEDIADEALRAHEWGDASPHLAHSVAIMARDSCAMVTDSPFITAPTHGVAPGLPLADITFGLVASRVARRVSKRLAAAGLLPTFSTDGIGEFLGIALPPEFAHQLAAEDVTYVDDAAYVVCASAPQLTDQVAKAMTIIDSVYEQHAFSLGRSASKSAVILTIIGEASQAVAINMKHVDHIDYYFKDQLRTIPIVHEYKHLGSWSQTGGNCRLDVVRKATQIRIAARPMRNNVLGNKALSVKHRVTLANSLVLSRGLFAAAAWPRLKGVEMKKINAAVVSVFRTVAREDRWRHSALRDSDVFALVRAPSTSTLLRIKRLRLFTSLIIRRVWRVLIMLALGRSAKDSWIALIAEDLAITAKTVRFADMQGASIAAWIQRITAQPSTIFQSLKAACELEDGHQYFDPAMIPSIGAPAFACPECGDPFYEQKELATHRARRHGFKRAASAFTPNTSTCPVCLLHFGSRGQLIEHLTRAQTCFFNVVILCMPLDDAEQATVDEELRALSKAARMRGLRSTHSGVPFVQAYGPVRPIVIPGLANGYSHHVPLRSALSGACRVNFNAKGLGGVTSENPYALQARAILAITPIARIHLGLLGAD